MENGPLNPIEIDGLPSYKMVDLSIAMLIYQRIFPINIPLNHSKIPLNHYNHYIYHDK